MGVYRDSRHSSKHKNKEFGRYHDKDIRKKWNISKQTYDRCVPQTK